MTDNDEAIQKKLDRVSEIADKAVEILIAGYVDNKRDMCIRRLKPTVVEDPVSFSLILTHVARWVRDYHEHPDLIGAVIGVALVHTPGVMVDEDWIDSSVNTVKHGSGADVADLVDRIMHYHHPIYMLSLTDALLQVAVGQLAILARIGPEGTFSDHDRERLLAYEGLEYRIPS